MKYLVTIIVAFALGAGAAWYFTRDQAGPGASGARGGSQWAGGPGAPQGGFAGRGPGSQQPPLVVAMPVAREPLYDTVEALGTAQANESVVLTAKVTDTVRRVNFEDGDYVEAGEVLVELTNREQEAMLAEARANLDDAENQLRRLQDLSRRGLAPVSDLDVAQARAAATEARLNTVVAQLRDRLIVAPFSGLLGFREVSPGTLLTTNTPITTIDDVSTIKLDFTVPETFLGVMTPGAKVIARSASYPNRGFEGIVRTVGSRVDPITRAITVRAHIVNDDRALRPGMLLTVDVVMEERLTLVVPEHAVFQIQDRAYVYRLDGDIARQQQIELGARRFGAIEVVDGLEEGDLVVTEGIIKLRDGVRVRLASAEPEFSGAPGGAKTPSAASARS